MATATASMTAPSPEPAVSFHALPHADGSASYEWHGHRVLGSVNGPLEASRRDELPDEAFIEVNVRLERGAGGTRERSLERTVRTVLRRVMRTAAHPRALIQVTLQVLRSPGAPGARAADVSLLPHLLNTALLALLDGNMPLCATYTAVSCATPGSGDGIEAEPGEVVLFPDADDGRRQSGSRRQGGMHCVAVGSGGEVLLVASEGRFSMGMLDAAVRAAQKGCIGGEGAIGVKEGARPLAQWLRELVGKELEGSARWRGTAALAAADET